MSLTQGSASCLADINYVCMHVQGVDSLSHTHTLPLQAKQLEAQENNYMLVGLTAMGNGREGQAEWEGGTGSPAGQPPNAELPSMCCNSIKLSHVGGDLEAFPPSLPPSLLSLYFLPSPFLPLFLPPFPLLPSLLDSSLLPSSGVSRCNMTG